MSLCGPMDCSPPSSSVHGIFQARILKRVAISYTRGSSKPRDWTHITCVSYIGRSILTTSTAWEAQNGLVVLNSFSFCLSIKLLISLSNWMRTLLGILGCRFFVFHHFRYIVPLPSRVSDAKSANSLMGVPLYVICFFSLAAFSILSLSLIFAILITVCLGVFLFGLILYGILRTSWVEWVFFPSLGRFSAIISSSIFLVPFSLSSPSGTLVMWMLVCMWLFQRSSKVSSFLFILLSVQW